MDLEFFYYFSSFYLNYPLQILFQTFLLTLLCFIQTSSHLIVIYFHPYFSFLLLFFKVPLTFRFFSFLFQRFIYLFYFIQQLMLFYLSLLPFNSFMNLYFLSKLLKYFSQFVLLWQVHRLLSTFPFLLPWLNHGRV